MGEQFGYRVKFAVRGVRLSWLGSWDRPYYRRFGAWRNDGGVTLRYRAWLLRLGR